MRIVIISDTHGMHEELGKDLCGDVLIHCGDFCDGFQIDEDDLGKIDHWFGDLAFNEILCIGGNHDFVAQDRMLQNREVFENATYLVDRSVEISGLHFYGSPWLPKLAGWAHFLPDDELSKKWNKIPTETDVLITHTPPFGILDQPRSGGSVGCSHLRAAVEKLHPKVHCFGHVHASRGEHDETHVQFYNSSIVDSDFQVTHAPFVLEL